MGLHIDRSTQRTQTTFFELTFCWEHIVVENWIREEAQDIYNLPILYNNEWITKTIWTITKTIFSLIRLFSWLPRLLVSWDCLFLTFFSTNAPVCADCIAARWLTWVVCCFRLCDPCSTVNLKYSKLKLLDSLYQGVLDSLPKGSLQPTLLQHLRASTFRSDIPFLLPSPFT